MNNTPPPMKPTAAQVGFKNPYEDATPWWNMPANYTCTHDFAAAPNRACSQSFEDSVVTWLNPALAAAKVTTTSVAAPAVTARLVLARNASVPLLGDRTSEYLFTDVYKPTPEVFTWTASEPCCATCSIFGGTVQVYFWPSTSSATLGASATLVNSVGYTFTSPSVYVAFQSLYATDLCGDVFSRVAGTTIAFAPDELSTTVGYRWDTSLYSSNPPIFYGSSGPIFTEADWADHCGPQTETFFQLTGNPTQYSNIEAASSYILSFYNTNLLGTVISAYSSFGTTYTVTHDPCSPTISIPKAVLTLNPGWSECVQGISGFYDPPYTLTAGGGFTSVRAGPIQTAVSAVPGSSPGPVVATKTADPSPSSVSVTSVGVPAPTGNSPTSVVPTVNVPPVLSVSPVLSNGPPASDPPASSVSQNGQPASSNSLNNSPVSNDPATSSNAQPATSNEPNNPPVSSLSQNGQPAPNDPPNSPPTSNTSPQNSPATISPATSPQPTQTSATLLPAIAPVPAKVTIDGSTITANPSSAFIIASQTLTPGGIITNSATVYSLASNGASLIVGGASTQALADPSSPAYVVGSQTLLPGAPAVTVSGTAISLQAGGSSVVIGSKTVPLSAFLAFPTSVVVGGQTEALTAALADITGAASLILSGTTQAFSVTIGADGSPSVVAGGKTEALSSFASEASGGGSVVIGTKTMALSAFLGEVTSAVTVVMAGQTSDA
ncbi:hypothetical protein LSUE1_G003636, partial [Lachnellula suecica]